MIPAGWSECTIEELQAPGKGSLCGGPFGSDLVREDYKSAGVPVIRGCNLGAGADRFQTRDLVFVSAEKAESLARNIARPGDVLFTQRGTLDQIGLIPDDLPWAEFVISQSQMKLTCDLEKAVPEYIYYFCKSPLARDYLRRNTIATGVPHTNLGILKRLRVLLPPIAEQRTIADALGTIDARLRLGRRMNRDLDRMARALFRAWFHDYEPVHANAAGERHATTDELTASLFPRALDDHDGFLAPRGWELRSLLACAEFLNGGAFSTADFSSEGLPVIKIAELKRGVGSKTRRSEGGGKGRQQIDSGDILFSWSGTPETSIGTFLWTGGPAWLNQHIHKVIPRRPAEHAFLYCLLRELRHTFVALARDHQTTGLGHVTQRDLDRIPVAVPPLRLLERFSLQIDPLLSRMITNDETAQTLIAYRDALLPQLISGQVRVNDL
ncbi:MAG: restriction endonuclease subunit S [Nannocystaceae bacterium]